MKRSLETVLTILSILYIGSFPAQNGQMCSFTGFMAKRKIIDIFKPFYDTEYLDVYQYVSHAE